MYTGRNRTVQDQLQLISYGSFSSLHFIQTGIYVLKQKQLLRKKFSLDCRQKDNKLLSLFTSWGLTVLYLYSFKFSPGVSPSWSVFPDVWGDLSRAKQERKHV